MKEYIIKILVMFVVAIAIVGIINAIGFMAKGGASFISILGLIIAVIPSVLLVIRLVKKDVSPDTPAEK